MADMVDQAEMLELSAAIAEGNRRALARASTLIESTREDHRARAS